MSNVTDIEYPVINSDGGKKNDTKGANSKLAILLLLLSQIRIIITLLHGLTKKKPLARLLQFLLYLELIGQTFTHIAKLVAKQIQQEDSFETMLLRRVKLLPENVPERDKYCHIKANSVQISAFVNAKFFIQALLLSMDNLKAYSKLNPDKELECSPEKLIKILSFTNIIFTGVFKQNTMLITIKNRGAFDGGQLVEFIGTEANTELVATIQKQIIMALVNHVLSLHMSHSYYSAVMLTLQDMPLPKYYKQDLVSKYTALLNQGIAKKRRLSMLLYGVPGTSKTSTAWKIISKLTSVLVFRIDSSISISDIKSIYSKNDNITSVLFIDDIDHTLNMNKKGLNTLLPMLEDELFDIIVLTANSTKLPAPILRSGRIDIKLHLTLPDEDERKKVLEDLFTHENYQSNDLIQTALEAEGLSHADLHALVKLAIIDPDVSILQHLRNFKEQQTKMLSFDA